MGTYHHSYSRRLPSGTQQVERIDGEGKMVGEINVAATKDEEGNMMLLKLLVR